jgi:predicted NBD/HSP70 family sugar kinase
MYIGIDVGGTNIRIAAFDSFNKPEIKRLIGFPSINNYKQDFKKIAQVIKKISGRKIQGIGVGVPAVLNKSRSVLKIAPNLKNWENKTFKKDLINIFKCPVVLANDTTAAAIGEAIFGHGKEQNFLFVVWGTGIGGASIWNLNNKIYASSFEPGNQIINWNGKRHTCGQRGCLAIYCNGASIEKRYGKLVKDLSETQWAEIVRFFSHGLINIIAIRPTDLIIISGGIAVSQAQRLKQVHLTLRSRLKIFPVPKMKISRFGKNIGLYGALALLSDNYNIC